MKKLYLARTLGAALCFSAFISPSGASSGGTDNVITCDESPPDDDSVATDPDSDADKTVWPVSLPDPLDTACNVISTTPYTTNASNVCYHVPYQTETISYNWNDPAEGNNPRWLQFDFYKTTNPRANGSPLLVYFHPNGATNHIHPNTAVFTTIINAANLAGWNVASVEFRHPVVDDFLKGSHGNVGDGLGYLPSFDTGRAMQFLREHANVLSFNPTNLFAVGYSRGSLALWQSLQPDLSTVSYPYSSIPAAFYGYQAQTTYKCDEYATYFILPGDQTQWKLDCHTKYDPYEAQFGSALDSISSANTLPIEIRYRDPFYLTVPGSVKQNTRYAIEHYDTAAPNITDPRQLDDTEHYPDMGRQLLQNASGSTATIQVKDCHNNVGSGLDGWLDFFAPYIH